MNRPQATGTATLKAIAIVLALGAAAHAAMPYLPLTGPPPLRVQAVRSPAARTVRFAETKPVASPGSNSLATAGSGVPVDAAHATSNAAGQPPLIGPGQDANDSLSDTFTGSIFALPTPDLLGISPQLLSAYFHPFEQGTNAAAPSGMLPLSFVPPLPPDKSSHAEYNVK